MPDESTRLGSDTELTRRPTRSTRFRVKLELGLEATYQTSCASVAFSVLFRASAVRRPDRLLPSALHLSLRLLVLVRHIVRNVNTIPMLIVR